jgi:hypothetical protein
LIAADRSIEARRGECRDPEFFSKRKEGFVAKVKWAKLTVACSARARVAEDLKSKKFTGRRLIIEPHTSLSTAPSSQALTGPLPSSAAAGVVLIDLVVEAWPKPGWAVLDV